MNDTGKSWNEIWAVAPADVKINKEFYRKALEEYLGRNPNLSSLFICHHSETFKKAWDFTNTRELILNDRERFLEEFSDNYCLLKERKEWDDEARLFSFNTPLERRELDELKTREDFLKWAAENAAE